MIWIWQWPILGCSILGVDRAYGSPKDPLSLWRWGDACFSQCALNVLHWPRPINCGEQALHDKWLKFKLEVIKGRLPNHSHGFLWHGRRCKREHQHLPHGSVQTRWKNEQQRPPCSPQKCQGNFTGESVCQGTCSSKIVKLLRRAQRKKKILQFFHQGPWYKIWPRLYKKKKRKKSYRIISFYEYWCKILSETQQTHFSRILKYSTRAWGLTQECK